ncbi:helix-turn-helix domain-containing protein [Pseudonocardia charpentierae]|uniref:Helix-turn-helix domain-containing protein n=1 Tax=Pseudonocardia charpentierae TaxID=3075545 RepID=A0ABU2NG18_9PSEU|nr:helix-turn-helix domain-containing protein [Pseudonocardia sp. DSM 45834]MDT0352911.1 helix-turn-helix domain-containing protein [Pseudonocardia sp. DSM 45834]
MTENERRRLRTHNTSIRPTAERDGLPAEAAEALADGPGRGWTGRQRSAVGRVLLAAGCPTPQVAQACGVSERTVHRWVATTRTGRQDPDNRPGLRDHASCPGSGTAGRGGGGGERGGHRAPLRIFTAHHDRTGTRAPEGHRD